MRISDWSSDVCSSDLFCRLSVRLRKAGRGRCCPATGDGRNHADRCTLPRQKANTDNIDRLVIPRCRTHATPRGAVAGYGKAYSFFEAMMNRFGNRRLLYTVFTIVAIVGIAIALRLLVWSVVPLGKRYVVDYLFSYLPANHKNYVTIDRKSVG